jgi:hypothetical protein
MVTLLLDSTRLEVVLSGAERALAFHRGNVAIERSTIAKVQLTDDAWTWLRGVPSPGTHLRGVIAMGTWRSGGGDDFVIIRRHRPSVVINLEGHPDYQRVILTTRHGLALVQSLNLEVEPGDKPADVVDIATGTIPVADLPPVKKARVRKPKPATAV